jgi:hypothetical protein
MSKVVKVIEWAYKMVKANNGEAVRTGGVFASIDARKDIHGVDQEFVTVGLIDGYDRDIVWEEDNAWRLGHGPRILSVADKKAVKLLHRTLKKITILDRLAEI